MYLFLLATGEAGVINCEVKDDDTASQQQLLIGLQIVNAYKKGVHVFEEPHTDV